MIVHFFLSNTTWWPLTHDCAVLIAPIGKIVLIALIDTIVYRPWLATYDTTTCHAMHDAQSFKSSPFQYQLKYSNFLSKYSSHLSKHLFTRKQVIKKKIMLCHKRWDHFQVTYGMPQKLFFISICILKFSPFSTTRALLST